MIQSIQFNFDNTGSDLLKNLNHLYEAQGNREHNRLILENIMVCQSITEIMKTANNCIRNHEHYNALEAIEQLYSQFAKSCALFLSISSSLATSQSIFTSARC